MTSSPEAVFDKRWGRPVIPSGRHIVCGGLEHNLDGKAFVPLAIMDVVRCANQTPAPLPQTEGLSYLPDRWFPSSS